MVLAQYTWRGRMRDATAKLMPTTAAKVSPPASTNGTIFEKNLGKSSADVGAKMTEFDPGQGWKEVTP